MFGKNEKCFSPWFGFMVILVVCVVIAGAVFFETKGSQQRRAKKHRKPAPVAQVAPAHATPVAAPVGGTAADGKVLF